MCGILAVLNENIEERRFCQALHKMAHRGPDNSGYVRLNNCIFGHVRLSIIDLSENSNQPIIDNDHVLIYNGEIYNYKVLAAKYSLSDESDSKLLFSLLKLKGISIVSELQGMFAFVFHDKKRQLSYAVRDTLGIKPLYWYSYNDMNIICSEIKPITTMVKTSLTLNKEAYYEYLWFNTNVSSNTFYNEIRFISPGEILVFDKNGIRESLRFRYNSNLQEFKDSCIAHTAADTKIGLLLSSGFDSTLIACSLRDIDYEILHVNFVNGHNEKELVARNSVELNKSLTIKELSLANIKADFKSYFLNQDYPSLDGLNVYLSTKAFRDQGIKVILSGLGGDEMTENYSNMKWAKVFKLLSKLHFNNAWIKNLPNGRMFRTIKSKDLFEFYFNMKLRNGDLLNDEILFVLKNRLRDEYKKRYSELSIRNLELFFYTQPVLLRDADNASMKNSVELRVPFLSQGFKDFAEKNDIDRTSLSSILKEKGGNLVLSKSKKGFELPYDLWVNELIEDDIFLQQLGEVSRLFGVDLALSADWQNKLKINSLYNFLDNR